MATTLTRNLNNYCVYSHRRLDTNTVFYVGKGWTSVRPYSKNNRNPHWWNIVNKVGYTTTILAKDMTNTEASELEIYLISELKNSGCKLVNMTSGGDGIPGWKHTPESRHRMSLVKTGKPLPAPPGRGLAISRAKLNKPTKLSRSVKCVETGETFNSCHHAAHSHGVNPQQLSKHLHGKKYHKTVGGRSYTWL